MRVICVILCLIISTSVPASAGFILWSSKHVTTNLVKDEAWITEALLAEEQTVEPLMLEATDNLDDPKPEEEQESTEPQETPTEATDPTEELIEPPVEDTPTPDGIKPQEEDLVDEPDHIEETGE